MNQTHELKVLYPYFDLIATGDKTFEVRKNDRGFQKGDILILREWHPGVTMLNIPCLQCGYRELSISGHYASTAKIEAIITYVYTEDPRFDGIKPGYAVLAFKKSKT